MTSFIIFFIFFVLKSFISFSCNKIHCRTNSEHLDYSDLPKKDGDLFSKVNRNWLFLFGWLIEYWRSLVGKVCWKNVRTVSTKCENRLKGNFVRFIFRENLSIILFFILKSYKAVIWFSLHFLVLGHPNIRISLATSRQVRIANTNSLNWY